MSDVEVQIEGMDKLRERLLGIVPKLQKRAVRNALAKGARLVRDQARSVRRQGTGAASRTVGEPASGYWKHGTVEKAISVRTSKVARAQGDVGVFVSVRPLKGGSRKNPNDPFYWIFLEFGTKYFRPNRGAPFLRPAAVKLGDALGIITDDLGKQISKLETNPDDPL